MKAFEYRKTWRRRKHLDWPGNTPREECFCRYKGSVSHFGSLHYVNTDINETGSVFILGVRKRWCFDALKRRFEAIELAILRTKNDRVDTPEY